MSDEKIRKRMSFPLSNLLVDPAHSKIWLNQLTAKELRDVRLVCDYAIVIVSEEMCYFL
jgi:hypothetical protein